MLVELPFAGFFLSKLLGTSADVDIHHLASLDPEVYKNLLFLKSYDGDVEELGLNFTVVNNELGEAQVRPRHPASSTWQAGPCTHLCFLLCEKRPLSVVGAFARFSRKSHLCLSVLSKVGFTGIREQVGPLH